MQAGDIFLPEVIGTMLLILLGNGVVAGVLLKSSKAENAGWVVITFAWGLAVMVGAFAVGQFSGAHLNPAVTIGLWVAGSTEGGDVPTYIIAQFIGAFIGQTLVWLAYLPHWRETEDPGSKLACFSTAPAIRNPVTNVICEAIGTFVLVFGILAITHKGAILTSADQAVMTGGLGPFFVGLLVVGIGMSLGGPTGYAINPARDLGPRIMHAILPIAGKGGGDWGYSWVPVIGPIIGAIIGGGLFEIIGWPA
jgi:glycerol uptake facilitator protein